MPKMLRTLALAGVAALAAAAPAAASPDQTVSFDAPKADWTGPAATGANTTFFRASLLGGSGNCSNVDEQTRCDSTIVFVDHPTTSVIPGASLKFRIDGYRPVDDFDLRVYDLGANKKAAGTYLGSPSSTDISESSPLGDDDPRWTGVGDFENKVVTGIRGGRYYRVEAVYFAVANGNYKGHVVADKLTAPAPAPAPQG